MGCLMYVFGVVLSDADETPIGRASVALKAELPSLVATAISIWSLSSVACSAHAARMSKPDPFGVRPKRARIRHRPGLRHRAAALVLDRTND